MLVIGVISIVIIVGVFYWIYTLNRRIDNLQDIVYRSSGITDGNINGILKLTDIIEKQNARILEVENVVYSTQRLDRR